MSELSTQKNNSCIGWTTMNCNQNQSYRSWKRVVICNTGIILINMATFTMLKLIKTHVHAWLKKLIVLKIWHLPKLFIILRVKKGMKFQTFPQILKYQGIWITLCHLASNWIGIILKSVVVNKFISFPRIGQLFLF